MTNTQAFATIIALIRQGKVESISATEFEATSHDFAIRKQDSAYFQSCLRDLGIKYETTDSYFEAGDEANISLVGVEL